MDAKQASAYADPVPVRLDHRTAELVTELAQASGLNKSEILRRAVRYAIPRFLSGEADLVRLPAGGQHGNGVGQKLMLLTAEPDLRIAEPPEQSRQ
jgi:hypothetical protein